MCLPKKTVIQYKNAIKEVKQKLKTVELLSKHGFSKTIKKVICRYIKYGR